MKNVSQNKNTVRSVTLFYILPLSSMYCLIEDSWIFTTAVIFSLLWYVWSIWRNPSYTQIHSLKRVEYFSVFSCNCEYSLLHQNSTSGRFLKVSCNVNSNHISESFVHCNIKNILVHLALQIDLWCVWFYNVIHWSFEK